MKSKKIGIFAHASAVTHFVSIIILFVASLINLTGCSVGYIFKAASLQTKLLLDRRPLDEMHNDPNLSPEIRYKIELVNEVTRFAKAEGFNTGKIFSTYVAVNKDAISWIVSASPPDALISYQWWFPVIGKVPYKGYFIEKDATRESLSLSRQGYDTIVRPVEAYSTLGWFNDPLLSTALERDPVSLTNLILHELTHSTIWIPNKVALNESLASFIAARKTTEFFKGFSSRYPYLAQAIRDEAMERESSRFLEKLLCELTVLYSESLTKETLPSAKQRILQLVSSTTLASIPLRLGISSINNAHLLGLSLYYRHFEYLSSVYERVNGNLAQFLTEIEKGVQGGPFEAIH